MSLRSITMNAFFRAQWGLFLGLCLTAALYLSWLALAKAEFFYGLWYDVIGIEQTITEYAPKNRYRLHFENTNKAEHIRLFAELVQAIHHGGRGLDEIVYYGPDGQPLGRLLTEPEITHLKDVAVLIDKARFVGWAAAGGAGLLLLLLLAQRAPMPSITALLGVTALGVAAAGIWLVLTGPVHVFYRLHEWIFPADHQWFFYYEESLMSTLMKAPDLFGYIGAAWALTAVVVLWTLLLMTKWLHRLFVR